jgi:succinyl-diaminopimelate desuccinylase
MTFTVTAEGAEGAYTHRSMGAIFMAMVLGTALKELIEALPVELPQGLKDYLELPAVRKATDETMGKGAADNMLKATMNIGSITGGARFDLIPAKCVFEADIRLPLFLSKDAVLARVDEFLPVFPPGTVSYVVQEAASHQASYSDFNHAFAKCIADAAEEVTGRQPVPLLRLSGSDCKFLRHEGVPGFVFGPSPSRMSGQDEAVLIEEFMAVVKTHTLAVFDYLCDGSLH